MPTLSDIRLDWIQDDPATQPRAGLDQATVDRYAEALERGERLPPVVVFHEDDKSSAYWLADGWHRRAAALKLERKFLTAEVHLGTKRDAMLYAAGANAAHGLPRSNEDKRRAVLMLLTDDEWRQWSDHEIARRTLTSQPFVSKLRRELSDNGYQMPEERLFQRGGETYTQNVNTEARVEAARARVEAELQARILDLLQKPLTTAQIRELLDIGLDDKAGLEALRRALETLVSEQRVRRLRDLYLPPGPTKAKPVADEEAVNLLRRVVAQHQRDFPTLSSIKIAWLRSHTLMNEDVLNAAIDALCEAGELERFHLSPLSVWIKRPAEREEVPEGSAEWQQGMAEDDARRQQTEADAEAEPDDELADDSTGDYEDDPPAEADDQEDEDDANWEESLPPTQTALDADRLLKLIPEGQAVSFEFLQEQTGLPKDRVVRAVNLLAADLKVKTAQRQVMRLAQDAIPAELRVAVLHLLHELRPNSESLLAAAWDGADYTDTSDAAKLAIREGWIAPVNKWSSGSQWCTGYVLTDAGRDVYAKLRAEHPDEVDDTLPPAVQRLYQRTVVELDRLINSASRATRVTQASMYLAGKLSDADAEALAQRIDLAQVRVRGALNSLTGLLIVLQPDDPDEV